MANPTDPPDWRPAGRALCPGRVGDRRSRRGNPGLWESI